MSFFSNRYNTTSCRGCGAVKFTDVHDFQHPDKRGAKNEHNCGRVSQLHEQVLNRISCTDKKKLDFDLIGHAIDQLWQLRNYGQGDVKSIDQKPKIRYDYMSKKHWCNIFDQAHQNLPNEINLIGQTKIQHEHLSCQATKVVCDVSRRLQKIQMYEKKIINLRKYESWKRMTRIWENLA